MSNYDANTIQYVDQHNTIYRQYMEQLQTSVIQHSIQINYKTYVLQCNLYRNKENKVLQCIKTLQVSQLRTGPKQILTCLTGTLRTFTSGTSSKNVSSFTIQHTMYSSWAILQDIVYVRLTCYNCRAFDLPPGLRNRQVGKVNKYAFKYMLNILVYKYK